MEKEKRCMYCGGLLPDGIKGNVKTHGKGDCRAEHNKEMIRKTNSSIKKERLIEILKFVEHRFKLNIDIDGLADMLTVINLHNIPLDDFVMTAYYFLSKSSSLPLTIAGIERAARDWDIVNHRKRTRKYKLMLKEKISKLEKILSESPNEVQKRKVENSIRRYERMLSKSPKIGFSIMGYNLVSSAITLEVCSMREKIVAMITKFVDINNYDEDVKAKMLEQYDVLKNVFVGRNHRVVLAGLFYHAMLVFKRDISMNDVVEIFKISGVAMRYIYSEMRWEMTKQNAAMVKRRETGHEIDS